MHHSSQNLTPKNIATTLKNIQHSNNKLWQQDKYLILEVIAFGPDDGDKSNAYYLFINFNL